jgi:hypothetical protein
MGPTQPTPPPEPPADADDWTNEQWIDWLKATDASDQAEGGATPATIAGRVVHSVGGQLLGQGMLGLAQAIYGQRDQKVVIVAGANSEPEKDQPFALHLDEDHPERSFAVRTVDPAPAQSSVPPSTS